MEIFQHFSFQYNKWLHLHDSWNEVSRHRSPQGNAVNKLFVVSTAAFDLYRGLYPSRTAANMKLVSYDEHLPWFDQYHDWHEVNGDDVEPHGRYARRKAIDIQEVETIVCELRHVGSRGRESMAGRWASFCPQASRTDCASVQYSAVEVVMHADRVLGCLREDRIADAWPWICGAHVAFAEASCRAQASLLRR